MYIVRIDTCCTHLNIRIDLKRVDMLEMGQSGVDRTRITIQRPVKMFDRLVARRRLFANVVVQISLMVQRRWTRVEKQDFADVGVNGVMIQTQPVQVDCLELRLRRQSELEV